MKCNFCGAENPDGVQICEFCGQPISQPEEPAQEVPTVSIEATRPTLQQMTVEEPVRKSKKKPVLIAIAVVLALVIGLVAFFVIRDLHPSKSDVVGTYTLDTWDGKAAWDFVVGELMELNSGVSREEIEEYLNDHDVSASKPESIYFLRLNEDGTCEEGGFICARAQSGTWTLKGNTVAVTFPTYSGEATYKRGKISTELDEGVIAVYKKMD